MNERRLFIFSAVLVRPNGDGFRYENALSWEITSEPQAASVGRFVQTVMEANPGFTLAGKINVAEIPRDALASMGVPHVE